MDDGYFVDRGVMVVGGTHGVGRAVALAAAQQGAHVLVSDPPASAGEGATLVAITRAMECAGCLSFVAADGSAATDVDRVLDMALEELPGLDVLVATVTPTESSDDMSLGEMSLADWSVGVTDALRRPFLFARRAVDAFLAAGCPGRIVFVTASEDGTMAGHSWSTVTTPALIAFARSITKEYGKCGIACNVLTLGGRCGAPATISPPRHRAGALSPDQMAPRHDQIARAAEAILFLASDQASFVNGVVLHIQVARPPVVERRDSVSDD